MLKVWSMCRAHETTLPDQPLMQLPVGPDRYAAPTSTANGSADFPGLGEPVSKVIGFACPDCGHVNLITTSLPVHHPTFRSSCVQYSILISINPSKVGTFSSCLGQGIHDCFGAASGGIAILLSTLTFGGGFKETFLVVPFRPL